VFPHVSPEEVLDVVLPRFSVSHEFRLRANRFHPVAEVVRSERKTLKKTERRRRTDARHKYVNARQTRNWIKRVKQLEVGRGDKRRRLIFLRGLISRIGRHQERERIRSPVPERNY
jgi:hypothetical protein